MPIKSITDLLGKTETKDPYIYPDVNAGDKDITNIEKNIGLRNVPDTDLQNPASTIAVKEDGPSSKRENTNDDFVPDETTTPSTSDNGKESYLSGGATGSGAEAALGTQYSWNQESTAKAQSQYSADVLAQRQQYLTNAQQIQNNAVNYQSQADMMKYQNNQNAEKVGWTGGYVLDQNRQMEYLKQSIQAQMYGAIELQKYGYDSALAAARLSYDLNQQEYARQYYQEAVTAALNEAQLTGTYFSAETKDMMSQRAVAEQKLKENHDDENAKNIIKTINDWFRYNGISDAGVRTLEAWQQDQANEFQWHQQLWTEYNAALQSAKTDIKDNATAFLAYDNEGNIQYDVGTDGVRSEVKTLDLSSLTSKGLADYIRYGTNGTEQKGSKMAIAKRIEQAQSYINYLVNQAKSNSTTVKTDKDGNQSSSFNTYTYNQEIKKIQDKVKEINNALGSDGSLVIDKSMLQTQTSESSSGVNVSGTIPQATGENGSYTQEDLTNFVLYGTTSSNTPIYTNAAGQMYIAKNGTTDSKYVDRGGSRITTQNSTESADLSSYSSNINQDQALHLTNTYELNGTKHTIQTTPAIITDVAGWWALNNSTNARDITLDCGGGYKISNMELEDERKGKLYSSDTKDTYISKTDGSEIKTNIENGYNNTSYIFNWFECNLGRTPKDGEVVLFDDQAYVYLETLNGHTNQNLHYQTQIKGYEGMCNGEFVLIKTQGGKGNDLRTTLQKLGYSSYDGK